MSNHNEDTELTTPPRQNPFDSSLSPSPPSSPMVWDESYSGTESGLRLNLKHERPLITPNSLIELDIIYNESMNHVELTVTNPDHSPAEPLSTDDLATVKRFLQCLRTEATKAINESKTATAHEGLLYIIHAMQVRMNQHWHATRESKEVSLDDLVGLLTMKDEDGAAESLEGLMQSLTVAENAGGENVHMVAYDDGDGGVRMLPGQDVQMMRQDRGLVVMNETGGGALGNQEGASMMGNSQPLMLENGKQGGESQPKLILHNGEIVALNDDGEIS